MNIIAPLSTEKAIRVMESENKMVFLVSKKATKGEIKKDLEVMYDVKVKNVNTLIGPDGKKRAYVLFEDETSAMDLATKLEIM